MGTSPSKPAVSAAAPAATAQAAASPTPPPSSSVIVINSLDHRTCRHCGQEHPTGPPDERWRCVNPACNKEMWNEDTAQCENCKASFHFAVLTRRHHCRVDGSCVCDGCSKNRAVIVPWLLPKSSSPTGTTAAAALPPSSPLSSPLSSPTAAAKFNAQQPVHRICDKCVLQQTELRSLRVELRRVYKGAFFERHSENNRVVALDMLNVTLRIQRDVNRGTKNKRQQQEQDDEKQQQQQPESGPPDETQGELVSAEMLPDRVREARQRGTCVVVVEGTAGSGKTHSMRMLAAQQSETADALVIFVALRDMQGKPPIRSLKDLFQQLVVDGDGRRIATDAQIDRILQHNVPLLILLDGFDEVQSSRDPAIIEFLTNFVDPRGRALHIERNDDPAFIRRCDIVVITSREERVANSHCNLDRTTTSGAIGAVDFWIVQRWSRDQVLQYCRKWFGEFGAAVPEQRQQKQQKQTTMTQKEIVEAAAAADVLEALSTAEMEHLAGLPLFVNLLCEIRWKRADIAKHEMSPSLVFELFVERTWLRSRDRLKSYHDSIRKAESDVDFANDEVFVSFLNSSVRSAAAHAFTQFTDPTCTNVTTIQFDASKPLPPWTELWKHASLLRMRAGVAHFNHRSMIEWLVARHVATKPSVALEATVQFTVASESKRALSDEYESPSSLTFAAFCSDRAAAAATTETSKTLRRLRWVPKFATGVLVILADYARRFSSSAATAGNRSAATGTTMTRLLAPEHTLDQATYCTVLGRRFCENFEEHSPSNLTADSVGIRPLLRISTLVAPDLLLGGILNLIPNDNSIDASADTKKRRFLTLLCEYFAVEGTIGALHWLERMGTNEAKIPVFLSKVDKDTLTVALARALDHQHERKSVENCIRHLVDVYKIQVGLEQAARVGSVTGVGRALASGKQITGEKLHRTLLTALHLRHFDVVATFIASSAVSEFIQVSSFYSVVVFFVLPTRLRIWDGAADVPRDITRDELAQRTGARLPAPDEELFVVQQELEALVELQVVRQVVYPVRVEVPGGRSASRVTGAKVRCAPTGASLTVLKVLHNAYTESQVVDMMFDAGEKSLEKLVVKVEKGYKRMKWEAIEMRRLCTRFPRLRDLSLLNVDVPMWRLTAREISEPQHLERLILSFASQHNQLEFVTWCWLQFSDTLTEVHLHNCDVDRVVVPWANLPPPAGVKSLTSLPPPESSREQRLIHLIAEEAGLKTRAAAASWRFALKTSSATTVHEGWIKLFRESGVEWKHEVAEQNMQSEQE